MTDNCDTRYEGDTGWEAHSFLGGKICLGVVVLGVGDAKSAQAGVGEAVDKGTELRFLHSGRASVCHSLLGSTTHNLNPSKQAQDQEYKQTRAQDLALH